MLRSYLLYLEVLAIAIGAFGIGYFFVPGDPLLLDNGVYLVVLVGVVTLFFGIKGGGFFVALVALAMVGYYGHIVLQRFLEVLVAYLLFGAFAKYWHERLDRLQDQLQFTQKKLRELGNAFYMLKLSHDQLELNYVLKPVSIRKIVLELSHLYNNPKKAYLELFRLLQDQFGIEKGVLFGAKAKSVAGNGELDMEDPLLKEVMEHKESRYIALGEDFKRYVAVLYGHGEDEELYLAIEKMAFNNFNEDNFHAIAFILDFFIFSLHKEKLLAQNKEFLPQFQPIFRYEYLKLLELEKRYNLLSSVLVFKSEDALLFHRIKEILEHSKRGLDVMSVIEERGVVALLAPFTSPNALSIVKKRVLDRLDVDQEPKSAFFKLKEYKELERYIES